MSYHIARTFRTMLISSGESGQLCLVSDLEGEAFIFIPLTIVLAVGYFVDAH